MAVSGRMTREGGLLRKDALKYPEAYEEMPWGHHAIKVKGKTFLFLGADNGGFSLSVKLPSSGGVALKLPFASPTEYGMGRKGWVTGTFAKGARVPMSILKLWIEESYRTIAPSKLLALLDGAIKAAPPRKKPARRQTRGK